MPYFSHPALRHLEPELGSLASTGPRAFRVGFAGTIADETYREAFAFPMPTRSDLFDVVLGRFHERIAFVGSARELDTLDALRAPIVLAVVRDPTDTVEKHVLTGRAYLTFLGRCSFFLAPPGYRMPLCHNLVEAMQRGRGPDPVPRGMASRAAPRRCRLPEASGRQRRSRPRSSERSRWRRPRSRACARAWPRTTPSTCPWRRSRDGSAPRSTRGGRSWSTPSGRPSRSGRSVSADGSTGQPASIGRVPRGRLALDEPTPADATIEATPAFEAADGADDVGAVDKARGRVTVIRPAPRWPHLDVARALALPRAPVATRLARHRRSLQADRRSASLWAVIQPFLTMVVFTLVFGKFANFPSNGVPYQIFVYSALLPWTYFSSSLSRVEHEPRHEPRRSITKVYFPRVLLPLAAVIVADRRLLSSRSIVLFGLMAWFAVVARAARSCSPRRSCSWALVAALGVGLFLSALNVRYRDVPYAVPFLIQIWLFVSPVVYSPSRAAREVAVAARAQSDDRRDQRASSGACSDAPRPSSARPPSASA